MLKAILNADQSIPAIPSIRRILGRIAAEHGVLPADPNYFDALVTSFMTEDEWKPCAQTISFFDKCACRIAQQPVHYQDLALDTTADGTSICLLPFCLAEQWPFLFETENLDGQKNVAVWVTRILVLLTRAGASSVVIEQLHSQIMKATTDSALKRKLEKSYARRLKKKSLNLQNEEGERVVDESDTTAVSGSRATPFLLETTFELQPKGMESMEGLERLNHEDIEDVVASKRLGRLCRSPSSIVEETRRQGYMTLQGMMKQIEVRIPAYWKSPHSDKSVAVQILGKGSFTHLDRRTGGDCKRGRPCEPSPFCLDRVCNRRCRGTETTFSPHVWQNQQIPAERPFLECFQVPPLLD